MTEIESAVWSMSSSELLDAARALARKVHEVEADLLVHLGEIDERKLYLECSHASLFSFCTGELGFSDAAAYNRVAVARAGRQFPLILDAIREGRVHLWGMRLLLPVLTEANHRELIAQATGKSTREIGELIVAIAPRPPVASLIRSIPNRGVAVDVDVRQLPALDAGSAEGPPAQAQGDNGAIATEAPRDPSPNPILPGAREPYPRIVPLTAQSYKIQFTASRAFRDKFREAQDLMRHRIPDGNLAGVLEAGLDLLIEHLKKERFAMVKKPRPAPAQGSPSGSAAEMKEPKTAEVPQNTETAQTPQKTDPPSRHIPDAVRRAVFERDGWRCTFVDDRGRRCPETGALEVDHEEGFALNPTHDIRKLRTLCRAHNQYMAEKLYGRPLMDDARKPRIRKTRGATSSAPPQKRTKPPPVRN